MVCDIFCGLQWPTHQLLHRNNLVKPTKTFFVPCACLDGNVLITAKCGKFDQHSFLFFSILCLLSSNFRAVKFLKSSFNTSFLFHQLQALFRLLSKRIIASRTIFIWMQSITMRKKINTFLWRKKKISKGIERCWVLVWIKVMGTIKNFQSCFLWYYFTEISEKKNSVKKSFLIIQVNFTPIFQNSFLFCFFTENNILFKAINLCYFILIFLLIWKPALSVTLDNIIL